MRTWRLDEQGSIAWIADPGERMQRASVALAVEGGCLVFDPVDAEGIDDTLAGLGRVLGVCQLLDRHNRDCALLAARHGAPRLTPDELARSTAYPELEVRDVYRARRWRETAVWVASRSLLIVPESIGTIPFFLAHPDDRLGMHPLSRLRPPRASLAGLPADTIAVGHGEPVIGGAAEDLRRVLIGARRDLPSAVVTTFRSLRRRER
jgi:hypothetical protein